VNTGHRFALVVLVAGAATNCRQGATSAYTAMHNAACLGDSATFFSYVSEDELVESVKRRHVAHGDLRRVVHQQLTLWGGDLSRASNGEICGWRLISAEARDSRDRLEVRTRNNHVKVLWFRRIGEKFVLVDYVPDEGDEGTIG
jgi:hypothetical protein